MVLSAYVREYYSRRRKPHSYILVGENTKHGQGKAALKHYSNHTHEKAYDKRRRHRQSLLHPLPPTNTPHTITPPSQAPAFAHQLLSNTSTQMHIHGRYRMRTVYIFVHHMHTWSTGILVREAISSKGIFLSWLGRSNTMFMRHSNAIFSFVNVARLTSAGCADIVYRGWVGIGKGRGGGRRKGGY